MSDTTTPSSATTAADRAAPDTAGLDIELELVVQRVRLRLALRLAWLTHLRDQGYTEIDIATADRDRLDAELEWRGEAAPGELLEALAVGERSLRSGGVGRVSQLGELFGLSPAEADLLHVLVAAAVDERVQRLFAVFHDDEHRRHVTEHAAARLCDREATILATAESPLRLWGIVVDHPTGPGEPPAIQLDPTIIAWLHGINELDHRLVGIVRANASHPPLDSWPVTEVAERCRPGRGGAQPDPTRIVVRGRAGSGRRSFAAAVCAELGLRAIDVDADRIAGADWATTFTIVQRQAFLDRSVPIWHGRHPLEATWPARTPSFPIQFVCVEPDDHLGEVGELVDIVVDLDDLSVEDRWRLWHAYVPASEDWQEPERSDVVERPHTIVGDIVHVARQGATSAEAAREALRRRNRDRLGPLVQPMPLPYRWDDLIVPGRVRDSIEFLLFECRQRRRFWEDGRRGRLYSQAGLVALFAGVPGVGKTMAAQIVAAELGVDLLRVNLAETISKYVGETAKNLEAVLHDARDLDAVLLCDEADTLFGRRTEIRDAHDRWANADTNYLLQAIESFPGIAILATNRKDQLDDAFLRRLRHVIELPKPDADARRALWKALLVNVSPGLDVDSVDDIVERLAVNMELTGAEIKHAALNAGFEAARAKEQLDADRIIDGLDRELAKQGRPLSDLERRRILDG